MPRGTDTARKEYYKQWRAKNKDKIRKYNIRYWERKAIREEMNKEENRNGREQTTISTN